PRHAACTGILVSLPPKRPLAPLSGRSRRDHRRRQKRDSWYAHPHTGLESLPTPASFLLSVIGPPRYGGSSAVTRTTASVPAPNCNAAPTPATHARVAAIPPVADVLPARSPLRLFLLCQLSPATCS